ncbi:hypothetical protein GGR26_002607 [Lewinella marina]|nr:hypothetical protein [Neolewinella marina]
MGLAVEGREASKSVLEALTPLSLTWALTYE